MKKADKSKHLKRKILLLVLSALLCVGVAELIACKQFEPLTYERIVTPVRAAATAAVDAGRAGLNAAARFFRDTGDAISRFAVQTGEQAAALWAELTAPKKPLEDDRGGAASSAYPTVPVTEPPVSQLTVRDGKQLLTGGSVDVIYFCQSSPEWADKPYGTDTIGPYGCGPTTMAMAVATLTGAETDPAAMAAWAVEHGHWASRSGSYHSIVLNTARSFGIIAEPFTPRDTESMRDALEQGKLLVALVGPGHFTQSGHFLLIRGIAPDGKILIADANSLENSLTPWDPQIILNELSSARDHGAPLWALQAPGT